MLLFCSLIGSFITLIILKNVVELLLLKFGLNMEKCVEEGFIWHIADPGVMDIIKYKVQDLFF